MLGEFFGLPVDTLWEIITSALVPAGTLDTLSALNVPGCPKASGGLTRSLWAEMVFPDVHQCISGQGSLRGGRDAGSAQGWAEQVGVVAICGRRWREMECRPTGRRYLLSHSLPSGWLSGTRLPDLCPTVCQVPFW